MITMIKRKIRKAIAILLTLVILLSPCAFAKSVNEAVIEKDSKALKSAVQVADKLVGCLEKTVFGVLAKSTAYKNIPNDYDLPILKGTDRKTVEGKYWKAGSTMQSIVPDSMRFNAKGERYTGKDGQNIDDYRCLKTLTLSNFAGSSNALINKMITDQNVYVKVFTNGCDINENGKEDLIVMISFDGEGITSKTTQKVREAVINALTDKGTINSKEDILVLNCSATHSHAMLDTHGMSIPRIVLCALLRCCKHLLKRLHNPVVNILTPLTDLCAMSEIMEKTMCEKAAESVVEACKNMVEGQLYFFNSDEVTTDDSTASGANTQNKFSNVYFVENGTKIGKKRFLISTVGIHPSSSADKLAEINALCGDFPYYMYERFQNEGIDFQFIQGAECGIYTGDVFIDKDSKTYIDFFEKEILCKDDYKKYFGDKNIDNDYNKVYAKKIDKYINEGFYYSQMILNKMDSLDEKYKVEPIIEAKFSKVTVNLDYSLLYFGSVSKIEGYNVVKCPNKLENPENGSETGYGIVTEVGYLTLGDTECGNSVTYIFTPGELSTGIAYGTDSPSEKQQQWQGKTSFSGKDWDMRSIEEIVKDSKGKDNNVVVTSLTNDSICYILADSQIQHSVLLTALFNANSDYDVDAGRFTNNMLLNMGEHTASTLIKAIKEYFPSK